MGQTLGVGNSDDSDKLDWCAALAASGGGTTLALGSSVSDPGCPEAPKPKGQVRLWAHNQKSHSWQQKGSDLNALVELIRTKEFCEMGIELTLSQDGNRVAMLVTESLPGGRSDVTACVVTFEWDGSEWCQVGSRLQVPGAFRFSTSMSQDGKTKVTNCQDTIRGVVETFRWGGASDKDSDATTMQK